MISALKIVGFKRFSSCSLEFAPLTILTGLNGAGKTTIIQALLLAREASLLGAASVALNGPFGLELGSAQDVLNLSRSVEASDIEITASFDDGTSRSYVLDAREERSLNLPIKGERSESPQSLGGSNREFTYLCAERLGPRDILGMSALPADDLGVGVKGEFCAQVLATHGLRESARQWLVGRREP